MGDQVVSRDANVAAVAGTITWLRGWWSQLGHQKEAVTLKPVVTPILSSSGLDVQVLATMFSFLPIEFRLPLRSVSRAWVVAAEYGPARISWVEAMGFAQGGSLAAELCRRHLVTGGIVKASLRNSPEHSQISTQSCLGLGLEMFEDTIVVVEDRAGTGSDDPDVHVAVYDVMECKLAGTVSLSSAPHARDLRRPLPLHSLQTAARPLTAVVVALERLVVVCSWQLITSSSGSAEISNPLVEEVHFVHGGKKALRCAAFVGETLNEVAVLLEDRNGATVEVSRRMNVEGYSVTRSMVFRGSPLQGFDIVLRSVVPYGIMAIWTKKNCNSIFVATMASNTFESSGNGQHKSQGQDKAVIQARLPDTVSRSIPDQAMLFGRARLAAKKVKLRVGPSGAGLDLEATQWGYLIEAIDDEPGQPDLCSGDVVISIGGLPLHGLLDEEAVHWRFGRNFRDGAELMVLPADTAKMVLDLPAQAKNRENAENGENAKDLTPANRSQKGFGADEIVEAKQLTFKGGLETYCVDVVGQGARVPARPDCISGHTGPEKPDRTLGVTPLEIIVVADNALWVADLQVPSQPASHCLAQGALKRPAKGPALRIMRLGYLSNLVIIASTNAFVIWAVELDKAEHLVTIEFPPRCNLRAITANISSCSVPLPWIAAHLGSDNTLDVWRFEEIRSRTFNAARKRAWHNATTEVMGVEDELLGAQLKAASAFDKMSRGVCRVLEVAGESQPSQGSLDSNARPPPCVSPALIRDWARSLQGRGREVMLAATELDRAAEAAEEILAETVRMLRHYRRVNLMSDSVEENHSVALQRWIEECRRCLVWPLQAAFEGDSDHELDSD